MVTINYNGVNPFENIAPTPFMARSLSPVTDRRYGLKDSITLNGVITGECSGNFESSYQKYLTLVNNFSQNFKTLEVLEDGSGIYSADYAFVRSISSPETKWHGIIPFSIELETYDSGSFSSGKYGISDSSDTVNFSENEDCTVSFTHSISAVGVNTDKQAYENARLYVQSKTGWSNQVLPSFITGGASIAPVLVSVSESPDRMNGGHSATLSYIYDRDQKISNTKGLLKYTVEKQSSLSEVLFSINGEFEGGRDIEPSVLRQNFNELDFYDIVSSSYPDDTIYNAPSSFSSSESSSNKIGFAISYSDQVRPDPYFIDETSLSFDYDSSSFSITVGGVIQSTNPCSGMTLAKNYYNNLNISGLALSGWSDYGPSEALNLNPIGHSYSENQSDNSLNFSFTFGNKKDSLLDDCIKSFSQSLSFQPSINQYSAKPILDGSGSWAITDLNYSKRARFSINGSAVASSCCTEQEALAGVKTRLNQISSEYFDGNRKTIESQRLKFDDVSKVVDFSASWSAETTSVI